MHPPQFAWIPDSMLTARLADAARSGADHQQQFGPISGSTLPPARRLLTLSPVRLEFGHCCRWSDERLGAAVC